jgi:hypothetical protein
LGKTVSYFTTEKSEAIAYPRSWWTGVKGDTGQLYLQGGGRETNNWKRGLRRRGGDRKREGYPFRMCLLLAAAQLAAEEKTSFSLLPLFLCWQLTEFKNVKLPLRCSFEVTLIPLDSIYWGHSQTPPYWAALF